MRLAPFASLACALAVFGCTTSNMKDIGAPTDAGLATDAGSDAGPGDAGLAPPDAGTADAGAADAGEPDMDGGWTYFPRDTVWYTDISHAPVDAESSTVIQWLSSNGGWGFGRLQIDFGFTVLAASGGTTRFPFREGSTYYRPDCDPAEPVPLPSDGAIEGESGYQCTSGGDCHLLVADPSMGKLFEVYQANFDGTTLTGTCLVVWKLGYRYPETGRGEQCTSTDAAGLPVAPLLFTADEVASGEIKHAIRFILPNARMRAHTYVHPATHAGAPSGPASAPPYGARFRLRADYPVDSLPSAGAKVIARAMQKYGMLLADGGNVALTAASDRFTQAKWADLLNGSRDLEAIQVSDFEMIDAGQRIALTYDCVRNPL